MDMPISHKVFLAQFDAIKSIAKEGPCVLVGRCADYALHDMKNCLHFFIYADEETKIKRLVKKYPDLNESKARDMMVKKDKQRQSYYNYCLLYTSDAADDQLCVDLGARRIIQKKKKNKQI